jgi:hypothetical protein
LPLFVSLGILIVGANVSAALNPARGGRLAFSVATGLATGVVASVGFLYVELRDWKQLSLVRLWEAAVRKCKRLLLHRGWRAALSAVAIFVLAALFVGVLTYFARDIWNLFLGDDHAMDGLGD